MTARDRILERVRAALPERRPSAEAIAAEAAALLAGPEATRPALVAANLPDAFVAKAQAVGSTTERVADITQVPQAVRRYLADHGLPPVLAMETVAPLAALDWAGLEVRQQAAADEAAALGLAVAGIAESGSLVLHSGPDTPVLLAFLALHHIVVLRVETLLPHLEDYAALMAGAAQPRNAILITGPSGTTDIEGSYVRGAHGPGFLHVILVE